jgi:hypothetical protein
MNDREQMGIYKSKRQKGIEKYIERSIMIFILYSLWTGIE